MEFSYYLPVHIQFGRGKTDQIGNMVEAYGQKALIVTGRTSAKKSGLYDRVVKSLQAKHIESVLFDEVEANPLTTTAIKGADLARREACHMVIALGGGSVLDAGKAIAFMALNEGDINDYIFYRLTSSEALPFIAVPTTCGTGSEGNGFAVLTNPDTGDKKSLRCPAIIPKVSIVDPDLMKTMSAGRLAPVMFDALCHNLEAYTSKSAQPFTDALALYALGKLATYLVPLYKTISAREEGLSLEGHLSPDEEELAWDAISLASTIGGMVIHTAGVTLGHGLEHPASGLKNVTHGAGLAALEPLAVAATWQGNPQKFAAIARLLGGQEASDLSSCLYSLLDAIDLRLGLSDLGISQEDIPWMVDNCLKVAAGNLANTLVSIDREVLEDCYQKAL